MSAIALRVPGDKSIAHRALMVALLAEGVSALRGLPAGGDVRSTAGVVERCGAHLEWLGPGSCRVRGLGATGPRGDLGVLDCGNSGTTMRLMTGLLAGRPVRCRLEGDASLSRRPMRRVLGPLEAMGARLSSREGLAPIELEGAELCGRRHVLEVASAQVKSALLFAGLCAEGATEVVERAPTRDHSERLLAHLGAPIRFGREGEARTIAVQRVAALAPLELEVPGDFSSAAFWLVVGALGRQPVAIGGVGVNPTRTGALDALRAAGAAIALAVEPAAGGEPVGLLRAEPSGGLAPLDLSGELAVRAIDELPLLMIASARIDGLSRFRDAAELRVKESDRIAAVARGLRALGVPVVEHPDGLDVEGGGPLRPAAVDSEGDHRIAMGFAVLAAVAELPLEIRNAEAAAVSYPEFYGELERAGLLHARLR